MKFLDSFELAISTLSPVHIGCGEDYEPTNYVIDASGQLHALDPIAMLRAGGDGLRQDLEAALADDAPINQMRRVHETLKKHAKALIPSARVSVPLTAGVIAHYRKTQDRNHDFNRNGIERTTYTGPAALPYIPGSSLKGAMRTAWLCQAGDGQDPLSRDLHERIKRFNAMIEAVDLGNGKTTWQLKRAHVKWDYDNECKGIERALKEAAEQAEKSWLGGGFETDPLRALKIGDGMPSDSSIEREVRFCVNRSRSGRKTQAQSKNLYTRLEYLVEHQPAVFVLNAGLQALDTVAGRRNDKSKLLAPTLEQLIDWPALVRACNDYYLPRLDSDLHVLRLLKVDSTWLNTTSKILDAGLREDIRQHRAMLLRVGKHAGADSNTVDGRQIKIMLNKDERQEEVRGQSRDVTVQLWVFDTEPRTTWYSTDDLEAPADLLPHGWVVLSAQDCRWMETLPGWQRRRKREEDVAREKIASEARLANERAAAEEERMRQAALAAMTPNQRRVEDFVAYCTTRAAQLMGNKESPNAAIHNEARVLAKAAHDGADWTAEEKCSVADAIEEWLPKLVKVDLKDERKKFKLAALRTAT